MQPGSGLVQGTKGRGGGALLKGHRAAHVTPSIVPEPWDARAVIIPTWEERKLRLREGAGRHTQLEAVWDLDPMPADSGARALSTVSQGTQAVFGGPKMGIGLQDTAIRLYPAQGPCLRERIGE